MTALPRRVPSKPAVYRFTSNARAVTQATTAAVERGLVRAAVHWHGEARQAAPVDTGRLRASIAFSAPGVNAFHNEQYAGRGGKSGGTVAYQPPPTSDLQALVGTNVEYAPMVHETHATRGKFIEVPGRENAHTYRAMIREELAKVTTGG